ncbi:MAG: electron transfer flavoprotein subunit beta/FixA family protein [Thermoplasmata archaeon]|nr:MAG: electron transfer flavoprotein subunit beta/FixA family protein [Thermoplasmata archaeon]
MNIIVLIKQVPDTTDVKIDKKTGTLIREGVPSIINPDDKHAIEEALTLRERFGGKVTVLSMGPPQALDALREAKAMGTDENILLSDRAFAGADTWATSYTLATAINKVGGYDLIICGRQAIDGDTAQVGPQVAECLGLPQITYVRKMEIEDRTLRAERALEDGYEKIETSLPALITVIKGINKPRYPSVSGIVEACREAEYPVWTAKDIEADPKKIGLEGSPTQVKRSFAPEPHGEGIVLEGTPEAMAKDLVIRLKDDNVVG